MMYVLLYLISFIYVSLIILHQSESSISESDCENVKLSEYLTVDDFEREAKNILKKRSMPGSWDYLHGGSFDDETIQLNTNEFQQLRIRPFYLRDVSNRRMNTTILGSKINIPIGVSPSAMHKLWDEAGEIGTIKAVNEFSSFMILSSASTITMEEVAKASNSSAVLWFQTMLPPLDPNMRGVDLDLIRRAEDAGYKAIVFTIDNPVYPLRYSTTRSKFDFKDALPMANFEKYPNYTHYKENRLKWNDFTWIKNMTRLPIVLKGILTAEDALKAVEIGACGIIVSNHGGRQLDGVPATIEVLPEIVEAVNGKVEVYLDGGIRSGKDVFKALALGVKAVLVGRAVPWGLVVGGKCGAEKVLRILKTELGTVMGYTGCSSLKDITRNHVRHKMEYIMYTMKYKSNTGNITLASLLYTTMGVGTILIFSFITQCK